jgi:molybdopterin molybdotransferase
MSDVRMLTVEEALTSVLASAGGPLGVETVPVEDALGRVAAEPLVAASSLPPWPNSAMDGYAIRATDVAGATEPDPVRLAVIGDAAAGIAGSTRVAVGTAIRIATGAPIPPGADAVVAVEATTPIAADGTAGTRARDAAGPLPGACLVHAATPVGANIRGAASDVSAGDVVLPAGRTVTPSAIALGAGTGVLTAHVHARPRVAILATGDELRGPGEPAGPAGIPDANGPGLAALARTDGCVVLRLGIAGARLDDVDERLRSGIGQADAVIVSGGVSVGPYDAVRAAFATVGSLELWRVAVQPGKPFAFGVSSEPGPRGRAVPLFGLPGNPVSTFVSYELFVRPALRALGGHADLVRPVESAVLEDEARTSTGRRAYLRAVVVRDDAGAPMRDGAGRLRLRLAGGQGSHVLSALARADGLAIVPEAIDRVAPGDPVGFTWTVDRAS